MSFCIIYKCGLYATTHTTRFVFFAQSTCDKFKFCPQYISSSKVKILGLSTFSETSRCISVFLPLTCLSDRVLIGTKRMGGTHIVCFTAKTLWRITTKPVALLYVALVGEWNSLRHHRLLSLCWTSSYAPTGLRYHNCCRYAPSHH